MVLLGNHFNSVEKDTELMKKYYLMAIEQGNSSAMYNLGYHYDEVEKNYELMKKYYLMAIEHNHADAMYNLACYYDAVERNSELMKKFYLLAITMDDAEALKQLTDYWGNNPVMLYKTLQEIEEPKRPAKVTERLHELERDPSVNAFNNKIRLFKRFNNYKECAICLEENVLNITLECFHEVCVSCYDPTMRCYLRCEPVTSNKRRRVDG
jgi:hypothetical protein